METPDHQRLSLRGSPWAYAASVSKNFSFAGVFRILLVPSSGNGEVTIFVHCLLRVRTKEELGRASDNQNIVQNIVQSLCTFNDHFLVQGTFILCFI